MGARPWRRPPCEDDVHALYGPYEQRLLSILHDFAAPKPHVLDAVTQIREMGISIGSTTGYNDKMMAIVVPAAREAGYEPDFIITPDAVDGHGRPYPYMMFRNMEALGVTNARRVAKVGDTVSDIREGKNAGCISIGVIEGSSEMAMTHDEFEALGADEFEALGADEQADARERVASVFRAAGADAVIDTFAELPALLRQL